MIPITIKNVRKKFGPVEALRGVSIDIDKGELFFLLGPSGCGKTTLLRSVAGFYEPNDGRIMFGQRDVTHVAPQHRDTGMVFQNYALWPHMTVENNVAFGLKVRKVSRAEHNQRVAEALETVQMSQYAKRKPNQLSGGQQQRVALARALVIKPQCLLLDEPLSNLDAKLRLDMRTEIRRLCKDSGLTALYVTHDQKEALSIADRMAVMFDGEVAQIGSPRELYRRPADARIADFLGETNFVPCQALAASGDQPRVSSPLGELVVHEIPTHTQKLTASVRPEAILIPPVENAVNRISGEVIERIYLGDTLQLALRVGPATLHARVTDRAAVAPLEIGATVTGSIDPRDIVVFGDAS